MGASTGATPRSAPRQPRALRSCWRGWRWPSGSHERVASHRDDELALGVSFPEVPESVGDLGQLVAPVDDRCHLPGLEQLSQEGKVRPVELRDEEDDLPAASNCRQAQLDDVAEGPEETAALRRSDDDEGRLRLEHPPALPPRSAPRDVEQQVVAPVAPGEVLTRVVDDVIGAERSREVDVPRAAHAGHLRSERPGDLHGERAHAARRAVDQHLLPRLDLPLVAEALQGGERRDGHGRRLLEREAGGLRRDSDANVHVLGEGSGPAAEDLVTGPELRDVLADRFHRPREVDAEPALPRLAEPDLRACDVRRAGHAVPVGGVDRGRADSHQHAVVGELRLVDLPELEDVFGAVRVADDRSHRAPPSTVRTTFPVFCPVSTYRVASTTSSSGYRRSMTARYSRASISSLRK